MPGYTKFDNPILEKILTSNLTKRQLKILLLVIRFSAGCQKSYAVLRKKDYAYAGVSPYCITQELQKLVKRRVIHWDAKRDLVWINPSLQEWTGDKPGEIPGDKLRRFFKIANKNLLKWQSSVYQNGKASVTNSAKISGGLKEKKERLKKENSYDVFFLMILNQYFLKVAPLREEEALVLQQVASRYHRDVVLEAIDLVSQGNNRSLTHFLRTLDLLAQNGKRNIRGWSGLRSNIRKRLKSTFDL